MAQLPLQRLYHANVVVNDLRATARNYARILGIARWDVRHWSPARLSQTQAYGYRVEFGYSTATGRNPSGVTFQLVQPTHGFSTFTEYLITRGEGIHSLCVSAQAESVPRQEGIVVAQSATLPDGTKRVFIDTRRQLGGYFLEVTTAQDASAAPDEQWDLSEEIEGPPTGVEWLARIPRIGHFGIAVSDLMARLPKYASLLGVDHWNSLHFRSAPGSLQSSIYNGQQQDNAWIIAITDVADFGLELLQGTREPTDYGQTIARLGEGIHHVLVRRDMPDADWQALHAWMESMGIGVVMSGVLRFGASEFFYLDTRQALGGYLLEVIVAHPVEQPASVPPDPFGRFSLDFSRPL